MRSGDLEGKKSGYIKGDPRNANDGVLRGIADARARESVMVDFVPIPGDGAGASLNSKSTGPGAGRGPLRQQSPAGYC